MAIKLKDKHYRILTVFLLSGKTFTFYHVHIYCDNESILSFSYVSASDREEKKIVVLKCNIVGFSTCDYDNRDQEN